MYYNARIIHSYYKAQRRPIVQPSLHIGSMYFFRRCNFGIWNKCKGLHREYAKAHTHNPKAHSHLQCKGPRITVKGPHHTKMQSPTKKKSKAHAEML